MCFSTTEGNAYVKNNPLKYTDPSGFFFKKIFRAIKKAFKAIKKAIVAIVVVVVVVVIAIYAPHLIPIMLKGAATGFLIGFVMGYAATGDFNAALKGAMWGAISAGIAWGIGQAVTMLNMGPLGQALAHGLSRGAIAKAQGGRFSSGFWSGFAGSLMGSAAGEMNLSKPATFVVTTAIGGTTSKIAGGKFANGAASAAFVQLFNHWGDHGEDSKSSELAKKAKNWLNDTVDKVKNYFSSDQFLEDSGYNQMAKVGNGVVKIYDGITEGFSKMMVNAPTYAKLPLYTAGAITTAPLVVAGVEYAAYSTIVYPQVGYGAITVFDGYYGGSSPSVNLGTAWSAIDKFIEGSPHP